MYRVVIVEDKKITREGLVRLVDWAAIDAIVIGDFEGGDDAIAFLRDNPADVVITDIEMENGDGIALARKLYSEAPQIKVIIISAYERFSYAHEAIRLGVSAYVLKPTDEIEVQQKVAEAIEKIKAEQKNDELAQQVELHQTVATLESYLNTPNEISELQMMRMRELEHSFGNTAPRVFVADGYGKPFRFSSLRTKASMAGLQLILLQCQSFLVGITFDERADGMGYYEKLCATLEVKHPTRLGVGQQVMGILQISESYRTAVLACEHGYLYDLGGIVFYDGIATGLQARTPQLMHLDHGFFLKCMAAGWDKEAVEKLNDSFTHWKQNGCHVQYILSQCIDLLAQLWDEVYINALKDESPDNISAIEHEMAETSGLSELRVKVTGALHSIFADYMVQKNEKVRPIVKLALDYSISNIREVGLNLKTIAADIKVSYVYLSKAFKEDFHTGYTEHMNAYRIELAKKLMSDPNMRIYEICESIGLEPKNFHFLFKKLTGMTPKDFQNRTKLICPVRKVDDNDSFN